MKKTPDPLRRFSKFLSLVLRHRPEAAGLTLDENGWVSLGDLIEGAAQTDRPVTLDVDLIGKIVAENDKKRFELSPDGTRIRARQGHSVKVELGYEPLEPPETLFHGTATRFLNAIRAQGLLPMSRHDVHLSEDHMTAITVGARHGKGIVLRVLAKGMVADGYKFYRTGNGVWLVSDVPPRFLEIPL